MLFLCSLLCCDTQEKPDFVPLWKIVSFLSSLKIYRIIYLWNSKCQPFTFRYGILFVSFVLTMTKPFHPKTKVFLSLKKNFILFSKYYFLLFVQEFSFKHTCNPHIGSPVSVSVIYLFFLGYYCTAFRIKMTYT